MKNVRTLLIRSSLVLGFAASMLIVLHPDVKAAIREKIKPENREILSAALAQFETGVPYRVVKVRTSKGIQIEIYRSPQDSRVNLVDRLELADHKDAYFNFSGGTTNLAVDDLDNDGRAEIIVPTLDRQLVAHLAIFQFEIGSQKLRRMLPDEIKY